MRRIQDLIGSITMVFATWMYASGINHGYKAILLAILFMMGLFLIINKENLL